MPAFTASDYYEGWTYQGGAFQWGFMLNWVLPYLTTADLIRKSWREDVPDFLLRHVLQQQVLERQFEQGKDFVGQMARQEAEQQDAILVLEGGAKALDRIRQGEARPSAALIGASLPWMGFRDELLFEQPWLFFLRSHNFISQWSPFAGLTRRRIPSFFTWNARDEQITFMIRLQLQFRGSH